MKVLNFELNLLELVIIAWCPVKLASILVFSNCVAGSSGVMKMSTWILQVMLLPDSDCCFFFNVGLSCFSLFVGFGYLSVFHSMT
jgi:hypothetical protein